MGQEIRVPGVQVEGEEKPRDVIVTLDKIPMALKERNEAIDDALKNGFYRVADPTPTQLTGNLASQVKDLAVEYAPSMAMIGTGAARGAAAGTAVGGPVGGVLGGLGGAVMGGIAGAGTTDVLKGLQGQPMPPVMDTALRGAKTGLEAEAIGMPFKMVSGGISGMPTALAPATTPRAQAVRYAGSRGIDLLASEQTGKPLFAIGESIAKRSLAGAGKMQDWLENRAGQFVNTGEQIGVQFGPPLDVTARSNRFVTALQTQVNDIKSQANQLFDQYVTAAGPSSPVPMAGVYQRARDIMGDQPLFQSLRNGKLTNPSGTGILDEINTLNQQGFQTMPLSEIRKIRTAIGDIAYPDRLQGTVIVDAPVAAARRLYGALTEAITANAQATGTLPLLQNANQFQKVMVNNLDSNFYKSLLDNERSLASMSKTLFNPRDPGVLLDAKQVVSPEGWKMLQQQYWDDVFTGTLRASEGGVKGLNGRVFAERLDKDKAVTDILFTPDQMKELNEFKNLARVIGERGQPKSSDVLGVMIGGGQGLIGLHGAYNVATGNLGQGATELASVVAPYFAAKVFTSPTATQTLIRMLRTGKTSAANIAELAYYASRADTIRRNKPDSTE